METKRNNFMIMLSLLKLLKPVVLPMSIAITMGVLGFISAFGLAGFGVYAVFSAIPKFNLPMQNILFGGFTTKTYLILLIICGFSRGVLHYMEQYFNHLLAFKILAMVRSKVFNAMQKLAPAKLDRKDPGQLISLIMGDIELLEVFYAHTVSPIAIAKIIAVLLFIFYLFLNPILVVVPLLAQIVIGIVFPLIASKKGFATSLKIREQIGDLNSDFMENLKGVRDIIQYDLGEQKLKNLDELTKELLTKQKKLKNQATNLSAFVDTGVIVFSVGQALVAFYLIQAGIISIPAGVIATVLNAGAFAPYINLARLGNTLTHTFACGERILSILQEAPAISEVTTGINFEYLKTIEFNSVDFHYNKTENNVQDKILKNINLKLKNNEILGITGKSGTGKSTMLKLLLRFWDPLSGSIKIDGHNLKEINTDCIYKNINYMTQTTHLFTGSIRSNLLIAKENATNKELHNALKKAAIYDFVMSLPNGIDSIVGEEGVNFSGGERQRFGLARCLLADKPILLLDEPTSNIDSINEAEILRAIVRERKSKTIVFVSHKISSLSICDKISTLCQ